jgi:hypothetical protein
MDLLSTFRRSSLYIRTAQSELINSDLNTYIRIGTKSELVNLDLAVRVDQIGSDLIESDIWCIRTDINTANRPTPRSNLDPLQYPTTIILINTLSTIGARRIAVALRVIVVSNVIQYSMRPRPRYVEPRPSNQNGPVQPDLHHSR